MPAPSAVLIFLPWISNVVCIYSFSIYFTSDVHASSSCVLLFQAQTKIAKKSALGKSETDGPGRIVVLRACHATYAQATGSDNYRQWQCCIDERCAMIETTKEEKIQ